MPLTGPPRNAMFSGGGSIRVDLDRSASVIEVAGHALAPMDAHVIRVIDALLAEDTDSVGLGLDLQVVVVDARQFHQHQDIVVLLKHVDGRKWAAAGGRILQPVAGESGFAGAAIRRTDREMW
jgi:hypothetical protein